MIFIIGAVMWIISICICIVLGGANIGKCDMFENKEITCKKKKY